MAHGGGLCWIAGTVAPGARHGVGAAGLGCAKGGSGWISVMLAGGAFKVAAERRASHDLRALLERAPRFARRRVGPEMRVTPLNEVAVDDVLVVGPGEVVPVDGRVLDTMVVLDESALTGEPLPVERAAGEPVRSGVVNAGNALNCPRHPSRSQPAVARRGHCAHLCR
jgi:cation transport ATPase